VKCIRMRVMEFFKCNQGGLKLCYDGFTIPTQRKQTRKIESVGNVQSGKRRSVKALSPPAWRYVTTHVHISTGFTATKIIVFRIDSFK